MSEIAGHATQTTEARRDVAGIARLPQLTSPARRSWGALAALVTGLGGLATGTILAAMLAWSASPEAAALEPVAATDIDAAAGSLFGAAMVATVEAAKSCRRPLGVITVAATGDTLGVLQFRSGTYVSPRMRLGRRPFRLALPYPAPLSAGAGEITVTSDTGGAVVFLRPGVVIPSGVNEKIIHVTWNPRTPCP